MRNPNHLRFTNTKSLKFFHSGEGVIASYKKKKYTLGFLSISHENTDFTDHEYLTLGKSVLDFQCRVRNLPQHPIETLKPIFKNTFETRSIPIYKYVSNDVYEKYIRKGIFQLGTINQYRTIENRAQRDEFEGYSFINLNINNHIVSCVCNSGFNYLIFCATRDKSERLEEQFGPRQLCISDVDLFASRICKLIGARRYLVQDVEYNSLKLYISKERIRDPRIDINNILSPSYFEILSKHLIFPSLFVKPETFQHENEIRIVFEMPKDIDKPLRFESKEILKTLQH